MVISDRTFVVAAGLVLSQAAAAAPLAAQVREPDPAPAVVSADSAGARPGAVAPLARPRRTPSRGLGTRMLVGMGVGGLAGAPLGAAYGYAQYEPCPADCLTTRGFETALFEPSEPLQPTAPRFALGDYWTLFTNQVPTSSTTFTGGAWEVGTRFYSKKKVCVMYFRFWRAEGETGTNRIRLWKNNGEEIASRVVETTGPGWSWAYFSSIVELQPYTYYRVSVNTNTAQVKSFGVFQNGPITNGPMVATDGYYGQPAGSFPTTHSYSNFFVDLEVVEC